MFCNKLDKVLMEIVKQVVQLKVKNCVYGQKYYKEQSRNQHLILYPSHVSLEILETKPKSGRPKLHLSLIHICVIRLAGQTPDIRHKQSPITLYV